MRILWRSCLDLGLDISAVAGDEVAANAGDVQPLQCPFSQNFAGFGVLLELEFNCCACHDEIPDEIAFTRKDIVFLTDFECLECDIQWTFMLFETLAFECGIFDEILHQFHCCEILIVARSFGNSEGCCFGDEEVERADEDCLVELEYGVRVGFSEYQLVCGVVIFSADGEEECLIDLGAVVKEGVLHQRLKFDIIFKDCNQLLVDNDDTCCQMT